MNTAKIDKAGVRVVAVLEAAKGLGALVGFIILSVLHRDINEIADRVVVILHLDPARKWARLLLESAHSLGNEPLHFLAWLLTIYAFIRFTEAYGLWNQRKWAEWFAIISCSAWIPLELYGLTRPSHIGIKLTALIINLVIVGYLLIVLKHQRLAARTTKSAVSRPEGAAS